MPAEARAPATRRVYVEWRAFVAALTFLTRIPAYPLAAHDASDLPASSAYFPIVGLVVAAVGGLAYFGAALLWPAPLAVVLSVASTVWVTGAFHEDAAADSFDGFGGGWSREQVLAIMKDSRVGSYALVGVTLLLFAKIASLSTIAAGAERVAFRRSSRDPSSADRRSRARTVVGASAHLAVSLRASRRRSRSIERREAVRRWGDAHSNDRRDAHRLCHRDRGGRLEGTSRRSESRVWSWRSADDTRNGVSAGSRATCSAR